MEFNTNVPAIVGEKVAGESAATRKELESVINFSNKSQFDIAELLYKIKKNGYYEGFVTFASFCKSLSLKASKSFYLTKMAEVMDTVGVPRVQYEPLGLAKLRAITSLDPTKSWTNPETKQEIPLTDFIKGFVEKGTEMSQEEVSNHVKTLKGLIGEEAMGWLHLYMKELAIEKVARPALDLAKAQIGSVAKTDEGESKDASDGQAAEMIFVSYLNDPANEQEIYEIPQEASND